MPRLPAVSGRLAVSAFQKADFEILRRRGGHIIIVKDDIAVMLSVPDHRQLEPGALRAIIRQSVEAACPNRTVAFVLPNEMKCAIVCLQSNKEGLPSPTSSNPNTYS